MFINLQEKLNQLQNSLKRWTIILRSSSDNSIPRIFKELDDIQQTLMINLVNESLWLQEKTL